MAADRPAEEVLAERRREKQRAREADERALASGEKSAEQLRWENGHFARLGARVDYDGARRRY
jgi:hypothetical protein